MKYGGNEPKSGASAAAADLAPGEKGIISLFLIWLDIYYFTAGSVPLVVIFISIAGRFMKIKPWALHVCAACCISSALLIQGCTEAKEDKTEPAGALAALKPALNLTCTGYVRAAAVIEGRNAVIIDTVQFFSGDAAKRQGASAEGYFIRNSAVDSLEAIVTDNTGITMQTFSHDSSGSFRFNEKVSPVSFLNLFRNKQTARFRSVPFSFDIQDGAIISVKEIYIP